ncbi:unnamed protein product [Symbiodinium necroappetens]|uniref:VOC domain-containing protein n=1 Tax=Symbiodinium necroappetens TaxID=1628268 RepID=A0A812XNN2_9DINO|nr:unnamed protein product [Symbiodinium necroappetens]
MQQILKINHVGLRVRSLEVTRQFYEKLGFEFIVGPIGPEPVAVMEHPSGVNINFILNASEDVPPVNLLMDVAAKHTGFTHIALEVDDLEAVEFVIRAAGIVITEAVSLPSGAEFFFVRDPDNNDADIVALDINDYEMPLYSSDREAAHGIPDEAHRFYQDIGAADALLISFAEHNGSYTAAYKNLYDWTSRIDVKVYQNKPTVMLSTSPGPGGAANVLAAAATSAPFFGADLKASMSVPSFFDSFDTTSGCLNDSGLVKQLRATLSYLVEAV